MTGTLYVCGCGIAVSVSSCVDDEHCKPLGEG